MRELAEFSATKQNLTSALAADYDKDAPVFSACRDDLRAAATALLTRAQQAGAVRPDVQPLDLLRLSARRGRGDRGRRRRRPGRAAAVTDAGRACLQIRRAVLVRGD